MVCMAFAGNVVVGSDMETTLDADEVSADAMDSSDAAAARADTNLMENMMWRCWEMGGGGGRWRVCRRDGERRTGDGQWLWSSR